MIIRIIVRGKTKEITLLHSFTEWQAYDDHLIADLLRTSMKEIVQAESRRGKDRR